MRKRLPLILSMTALIVAVLGSTPVVEATTDAVETHFARNARFLRGKAPSVTAKPNTIVQRDRKGRIRGVPVARGLRGLKGDKGDKGDRGERGAPGQDAVAPAGAVMFFNVAACPAGWSELATARGRYLVGLPPGGALGSAVGTALGDQENRAVGQHTHGVTDPGHSHLYDKPIQTGTGSGSSSAKVMFDQLTGTSVTGITINPAGGVAGTNAPYLQLLVCQKS